MLLRLVNEFRRAMDLSLVLDQESIPHELRSLGDEQWALAILDDAQAERAESAIAAFERENPPAPPPEREAPIAPGDGVAAGLVFCLAILALQIWTGPESDNAWFAAGTAQASAILRGEWWRAITALTLHADAGHAVGNALLGGLLLTLLARRIGTGMACWAMLLAGALGTLGAAALMQRNFASVGASTAVFGALAELSALQAADPGSRRRAWIPLGAGVALLGFLGTSRRADFAGHLCGFGAGVLIGFAVAWLPRLRSALAQATLAVLSSTVPVLAWIRALGHLTR